MEVKQGIHIKRKGENREKQTILKIFFFYENDWIRIQELKDVQEKI